MKLSIKNLGPIKDAEIETGRLTVFTGRNHTGKTWAMNILYGAMDQSYWDRNPFRDEFESLFSGLYSNQPACLDFSFIPLRVNQLLVEWFNSHLTKIFKFEFHTKPEIKAEDNFILANENIDKFKKLVNNFIMSVLFPFEISITENDFLFRKLDFEEFLALVQKDSLYAGMTNENLELHFSDYIKKLLDSQQYSSDDLKTKEGFLKAYYNSDFVTERFISILYAYFYYCFHHFEIPLAIFIPAGRSGLHLTYLDLDKRNSDIVRRLKLNDDPRVQQEFNEMVVAQYPHAIENYIKLLDVNRDPAQSIPPNSFQDYITRRIAKMEYSVNSQGLVYGTPQGSNEAFPIHMISSTGNNLYGLWLAVKGIEDKPQGPVRKRIIFIDEPELNLHPENQQLVARLLVQLVNSGVDIVVSTHSDYIVKELNTMMMLFKETPERAELEKRFDFDPEGNERLNPDFVKAYHFTMEGVAPCTIEIPGGIEVPSMNETIAKMNLAFDLVYNSHFQDDDSDEDSDDT